MSTDGMASIPIVLAAALGAVLFFTCLGAALARWIGPSWAPADAAAPALGWAVFTALVFPLQNLVGFTAASTGFLAIAALVASVAGLIFVRGKRAPARLPAWAYPLAVLIALIPLAALLPKHMAAGIALGAPASDHAKIAMIDEMTRLGLPVGNPFFGAFGARSMLSYYYLWHFGAAQVSILGRISGWEADAAMTGFTAYASILLMMGLASKLATSDDAAPRGRRNMGGRVSPLAIVWVALLSLTGSLRPLLSLALGPDRMDGLFASYRGVEAWMAQASWVPQHLASACCVVLAVLLLADRSPGRRIPRIMVLGALAAAAFGSSAWVGGVTFVAVAAAVGLVELVRGPGGQRIGFAAGAVGAAVVAVVLALPLLNAEFGTLAGRHGGAPVAFHPYEIFGAVMPLGVRRVLDLPAFWLLLLPIDLPATYPAGMIAGAAYLRRALRRPEASGPVVSLAILTLVSLTVSWLLISTIGNNDLGWRAVLPASLVLTPFAALGLARWITTRAYAPAACALVLFVISLDPLIIGNIMGKATDDAADFAEGPALWADVRKFAGPTDRVANNPLYLDDLTGWPVNPSWALLSDRPSCYSGWETARAYVALPSDRIDALNKQFTRVFDGHAAPDDLRQMAQDYGCRVVALTDSDGAWTSDPFAASPYYRLAETTDEWRIYVSVAPR